MWTLCAAVNVLGGWPSLADFQATIIGRFWATSKAVITLAVFFSHLLRSPDRSKARRLPLYNGSRKIHRDVICFSPCKISTLKWLIICWLRVGAKLYGVLKCVGCTLSEFYVVLRVITVKIDFPVCVCLILGDVLLLHVTLSKVEP